MALLRFTYHTILPLNYTIQCFLVYSQKLCAVITTVNFRTSLPPKRKPQTRERSLPISPSASSQPLATADLLFVSGLAYSGHVRSVGSYNMWPLVSELFRFGIMLSSSLHGGIHHYSIPLRSWIIFHHIDIPRVYPPVCWWMLCFHFLVCWNNTARNMGE